MNKNHEEIKMKKLLIASTALVASAGIASADITLSGSAAAGFHTDLAGAPAPGNGVYSNIGVVISMSTTTDSGITFSSSMDAEAGIEIDTGDFEWDGAAGTTFALGNVSASGAFGTLSFDSDGIDNLYDDDRNGGDVSFSTTVGSVSVAAVIDTDDSITAGTTDSMSASASFTSGAMTISGSATTGDAAGTGSALAVSYAVSDSVTVSADTDNAPGAASVNTVGVATSINGISVSADASSDSTWDLDLGYTLSGVALTYSTTDANAWDASASMSLGGGATAHAGTNAAGSTYAGVSLSF